MTQFDFSATRLFKMTRRACLGLLAVSALSIGLMQDAAANQPLAAPKGDVLLKIIGNVANANADSTAAFDRDMLDAMPQVSFETTTQWTEGMNRFSGPSLRAVLDMVGADGALIKAKAANDYVVEIPFNVASETAPIIATTMNGQTMSLREKGPLWIVFPYDSSELYRTGEIYSYSIWQLVELNITDR
jgi:hypothetical protein